MKLLYRITVTAALLVIGACIDNPSSSSGVTSDFPLEGAAAYFPVSVGNTWVYAVTDRDRQSVRLDTVKVTGVVGDVATLMGPGPYEREYRVSEDAVTLIAEYEGIVDTSAHLVRTPLSVGTQWQSYFDTLEIVAVDTTIDTPAGSFNEVVVVRASDCLGWYLVLCVTSYDTFIYYAKGVGPVKYETWNAGGTGYPLVNTRSLVSYGR